MDWEKMNFRTEKEGKGKLSSPRCLTRAGAGDYFSFPHSHNHRHNHLHIHCKYIRNMHDLCRKRGNNMQKLRDGTPMAYDHRHKKAVCHGTRGLTIRAVASYVKQLSFVPA